MTAAGFAACIAIAALALPQKTEAAVAGDGKVYLENIDVTGMSQAEIQAVIDAKMEQYRQDIIQIFVSSTPLDVTGADLGIYYENTDLAETIASVGLNGNVLQRYDIDNYISDNGAVFFSLDLAADPESVYNIVATQCTMLNKAPVNMKLGRNADGTFYTIPKENGYNVLVDETANILYEYLCNSWHGGLGGMLALTEVVAAQGMDVTDVSQITSVLGMGTTYYPEGGEFATRCVNIEVATAKINGSVIYPGEEFSAEALIEPCTVENGYQIANGYEGGHVVDTVGGGICQVTSTLYRAVLESELTVTERNAHSMIVGYCDPSMDATVADNILDLKFVNNTDAPIYIEGAAGNGAVTFVIYGHETRPAGRTIGFYSEAWNEVPASIVYLYDADLDFGQVEVSDPHNGLDAVAYKVIYQDGVQVGLEQISTSHYVKSDGEVRVGVRGAPAGVTAAMDGYMQAQDLGQIYAVISAAQNGAVFPTGSATDQVAADLAAQQAAEAAAAQAAAEAAAAEAAAVQ